MTKDQDDARLNPDPAPQDRAPGADAPAPGGAVAQTGGKLYERGGASGVLRGAKEGDGPSAQFRPAGLGDAGATAGTGQGLGSAQLGQGSRIGPTGGPQHLFRDTATPRVESSGSRIGILSGGDAGADGGTQTELLLKKDYQNLHQEREKLAWENRELRSSVDLLEQQLKMRDMQIQRRGLVISANPSEPLNSQSPPAPATRVAELETEIRHRDALEKMRADLGSKPPDPTHNVTGTGLAVGAGGAVGVGYITSWAWNSWYAWKSGAAQGFPTMDGEQAAAIGAGILFLAGAIVGIIRSWRTKP